MQPELTSGRSANDLASSLSKVLEDVPETFPKDNHITWSDGCVPQNRNSIMTTALIHL